ncbi:MAG: carboxypeptidase regulatory-like domain-containing protein [Desulfuromonadales bacterium]|jgi:Fe-S-cluster-containing dehydrogenase component
MARYGMAIDLDRCIGCYNCQVACKDEHVGNDFTPIAKAQPTFGHFWMGLKEQERVLSDAHIRVYYYPHMCNHCDDAPCIKAAKGGSVYKRNDGIVIVDPEKSVGQKQLVEACPYGAIFWNEELNIPQKCTFCAHLLEEGWSVPRCVQTCPTDCLIFGDLDDPESRISKFVAERQPKTLYPEHQTRPRVTYAGLPRPIVSGTVVKADNEECGEGARVELKGQGGTRLEAQADAYGDFCFNGAVPGKGKLTVSLEGYNTIELDTDITSDVTALGDIVLSKA